MYSITAYLSSGESAVNEGIAVLWKPSEIDSYKSASVGKFPLSVDLNLNTPVVKFLGLTKIVELTTPSPFPSFPWQGAQTWLKT